MPTSGRPTGVHAATDDPADPTPDRGPVTPCAPQSEEPLVRALLDYVSEDALRLHVPGHKGRVLPRGLTSLDRLLHGLLGEAVFLADATELPGLDDLHSPCGPIKEAQRLAALAYEADESFLLVNGSTCGIHAMVMASCRPGDEIIVPRDSHRAVVGALVLSGARPVYLAPDVDDGFDIPLGPTPESLREALEARPGARAVLLTNPNYYGVAPDIKTLVALVHRYGRIALVDESHGAHLPFYEGLPPSALAAGADAVVSGMHKVLPAMTQASLLHLRGSRIDRDAVARALRLLETSSPSYVLMASVDSARSLAATRGRELLERVVGIAERARDDLDKLPGMRCLRESDVAKRGRRLDPTKLVISCSGLGVTGLEVAEMLRREHRVLVELADARNILAVLTIMDAEEDVARLARAIGAVASALRERYAQDAPRPRGAEGVEAWPWQSRACAGLACLLREFAPVSMWPREAVLAPVEWVAPEDAAGRVASDVLAPYPPGIALIWPGEEVTEAAVRLICRAAALGIEVQGMQGGRIPVVAGR